MEKLERLMNLIAALLHTPTPLTADEIQRRVPGYPDAKATFQRAFERDKDDLREMGVPLQIEPVPGRDPPEVGYRIRKDEYYLPNPDLEPDELAALHLAASAVRMDGVQGPEALWKLGGTVGEPEPGTELAALPTTPTLTALFGAVVDRRTASFGYRGEERQVDPYRLDFLRGRWYLTAFDHDRQEERHFRLDRIEGDLLVGDPGFFERPASTVPGLRMAPWELGEGEEVTARLLVDADQAPWAVQTTGPEAVVDEKPDGAIVLELPVVNRDAFRSFVLTFLDHAEVLGPPELRNEFVAWLEALG